MLKKYPVIFIRIYFFWMVFFAITRLIFLSWNREELHGAGAWETISVFFHALYIDTSMAAYFLVIPWFLFTIALFTEKQFLLRINKGYSYFLIVLVSIVTIAEIPIYDEWHTKLNFKAIWFMGNPSEVFHTATWKQMIFGIIAISLLSWLGIFLFKKFVPGNIPPERKPWWQSISFALVTPCILPIVIRGGLQPIPVQVSDAYYSQHNVLNLAAANSTFNLLSDCLQSRHAGEPYHFLSPSDNKKIFAQLNHIDKDTTIHLLTTNRPNVVLVVLEGWSADMIRGCGGYDSIAPHFDALAKDGILFTNCYATGSLSDQGMAAVFSAFPAQPKTSVITQPEKYVHLPCINESFKKAGYKTSFMFGGQLSYGNIRSYMYYNAFDKIIEGKDFDSNIPQCRLGVADEYLFTRQLHELSNEQQPFFAAMFTLSTHGPYDFPMQEVLHWGDKEREYINSVFYSDRCIGNFIAEAKKYPWYKNTLFIFVSDHSHNSPHEWAWNQPEFRHIPMLFYGDVIKPEFHGYKYDSIASQTDLGATLLHQLDLDAGAFSFSKNLFNPYTPHYAWFAFDEGFGIIEPEGHLSWYVRGNRYEFEKYSSPADKQKLTKDGQAFLQTLMDTYFSY